MQKNIISQSKKTDTRSIVLCSLFASLVCVGAFIKIPFGIVPFTMQWFFVAMAGLVLGSRRGATSVLVYIVLGLIGLPVFTEGGGISYILNPKFGYIIGFMLAAFVIGKLTENKEVSFKRNFLVNLVGLTIVYTIGFIHLYFIMTIVLAKSVTAFALFKAAVLVFIPTDILSAALSAKVSTKIPRLN